MIVPLVILAVLSVVGGWVGPPMQEHGNLFHNWLAPVFAPVETHGGGHAASAAHHEVPRATEWLLIVLSVGVALAGIALAFRFYLQKPAIATSLRQRFAALHRMLLNKYWVDELYDATVVRGTWAAAAVLQRFDAWVIDGFLVNGLGARLTVVLSMLSGLFDKYVVDGLVNLTGFVLAGSSRLLRRAQTGLISNYGLVIAGGAFFLVCCYIVLRQR
jgi:NADH-quinone oxidoreductase subunit L